MDKNTKINTEISTRKITDYTLKVKSPDTAPEVDIIKNVSKPIEKPKSREETEGDG